MSISNLRTPIYIKNYLFLIGLFESLNFNTLVQVDCVTTTLFLKKKYHSIQTLRSPNRHKIAMFHTTKQINNIHITLKFKPLQFLKIKTLPNNIYALNILIIKLFYFYVNFFESNFLYIKKTRISIDNICSLS